MKTYIIFLLTLIGCIGSSFSQQSPELRYPHPLEITRESSIVFKWNNHPLINETFQFQLATDSTFLNIVQDVQTANSTLAVNGIGSTSSTYYWRVKQVTPSTNWSEVRKFFFFQPTSISGLTVWLDPSTGVTLNGTKVQQIADQSGLLNNAVQNNAAQQPLFVASDSLINRKPSVKYDGVDDFMEMADNSSLDYTSSISIHTLVRPRIAATNKTILAKWDYQTQGAWVLQTEFATADELMFAPCYTITDPGNQKSFTLNADMVAQKPSLLTLVYDGNATQKVKFFKNLNQLSTSLSGTIPSVLPNCSATLKLGKYGGVATRYYDGDIVEALIYNNVLSDSLRNTVDGYLRYKYAPPVDLGNDTIIAANALCGSLNIRTKSRYQTYAWSTGSTASAITVTTPGTYWVSVTDFLGNNSTDTIIVHPPYAMNTPVNDQICENSTHTWAPSYPAGFFTYLWQNGSTAPSFTYTQAGSYHVKITDLSGCFIYSDTLNVTVDTYSSSAFLGNDTSLCSGNFIALQIGAGETVNYSWPDGSTTYQYAVDTTGNYFVQSVNVNGCIARDTIHVNVVGIAPIANFTTANVCDGLNATFTDNSVPIGTAPIDSWIWDFGDSTNAVSQSPMHVYNGPGNYVVELYVAQGGCGAFHYDTVTVYANPQPLFTFDGYCQGLPVQFYNETVQGDAPVSGYYWNFDMPWTGAYNTSNIPIPYREFDSTGVFDVELTVTDTNNCTGTIVIPVNIDPSPEVTFSMPNGCENQSVSAQFTGTTQGASTYLWNFGDNSFSILTNTDHTYTVFGPYTVSLAVTNQFGCTVTGQDQVSIFTVPVPSFDLGPYCKGTYVEMSNTSTISEGNIAQTTWVINANDTVYGNPGYYLMPSIGQQQIEVISMSNEGCISSTFEFIEVEDSLNVSFEVGSGIAAVGEPFAFNNTTTGTNLTLWNFGDESFSSEFSPTHIYGEGYTDSSVLVYLIGMNASGCVDTAYQTIDIYPADLNLELSTIYLQENGAFNFLGVKLKNLGSLRIKKIEFDVFSQKGDLFKETWDGNLLPSNDTIYVFQSQPSLAFSTEDDLQAFVCVNSVAFDWQNQKETQLIDNDRCLNLEGDEVIVTSVAPNPAVNSMTLQLIVSKTSTVEAILVDANGKVVKQLIPFSSLDPGIIEYTIDIRSLENGVYFLKCTADDQEQLQRIVVLH